MPNSKRILCIGDTSIDTDQQCQTIAVERGIPYQGMVHKEMIECGCYHVSLGDKTIQEVEKLINDADEVVFLDQPISDMLGLQTQILKNVNLEDGFHRTKISSDEILFVGCSHTAGVGHSTTKTVYTDLVADNLQLRPLVRGFPGCGNFLFEDTLSEYDLTNSNVIIQYSDIFRIRYYDPDTQSVVNKVGKDFNKFEYILFSEPKLKYEFEQLVYRVVARLRDANAKFLFFQLTHENNEMLNINLFLSKFKEFCWTPDINIDVAEDNAHYGVKSHSLIAQRLISKWNSLYA